MTLFDSGKERINSPVVSAYRFLELDSMRGLAALIVVVHHFKNIFYKQAYISGLPWFFLHPFVAGHESVMLFFLLSGFVLALPRINGKAQSYSVFIRRRILRIYGPYVGALALAIAGCSIWHSQFGTIVWPNPVSWLSALKSVLFLGNYDYSRYNMAFWSLVYEMRISIIFPVLFILTMKLSKTFLFFLLAILTGIGAQPHSWLARNFGLQTTVTLEYAAIFMLGIVLARNIGRLTGWYKNLKTWQRVGMLVVSLLVYNESYRLVSTPFWHLGDMPITIGVIGLIIVGLGSNRVSSLLKKPPLRFLGRISYSLYLIHGTVLFTLYSLLHNKISPLIFFAIYLPAAMMIFWLFYVTVEEPFMKMSQAVKEQPGSLLAPIPIEVSL